VDVNKACQEDLLRVPGIGPTSARRIVTARRNGRLGMAELKKIGVVLKRAQYFIITSDFPAGLRIGRETTLRALIDPGVYAFGREQLSLFSMAGTVSADSYLLPGGEDDYGVRFGVSERNPVPEINVGLPMANDVKSVAEGVEEAVLSMVQNR